MLISQTLWNIKIILGVDEWDICLESNQKSAKILNDKNIPFWFDERKWAEHDWTISSQMFPHYLYKTSLVSTKS